MLILLVSLLILSPRVFAATLTLDSIGALDTSGKVYTQWWYTGTSPVLSGTAEENATVNITVDDEDYTTGADSAGKWAFWSDKFKTGDFDIEISSGGETISFMLYLGQDVVGSTESTTSVPETGSSQLWLILGGSALALLGLQLFNRKTGLAFFERTA